MVHQLKSETPDKDGPQSWWSPSAEYEYAALQCLQAAENATSHTIGAAMTGKAQVYATLSHARQVQEQTTQLIEYLAKDH